MKLEAVQADITTLSVETIVNAANTSLLGGGGVDGAIHRAAGPNLLEECRALNGCNTGNAKITSGYNLPARFVIHTVGPVWHGGNNNEDELLKYCYLNSMKLALENDVKSIAFPSISTGIYRFPFERACRIAVSTASDFIKENESIERVIFACFSDSDFTTYKRILKEFVEY